MSDRGQPPQPQQIVQVPASAHLPDRLRRRLAVLGQELIAELRGQDAQDLGRVVRSGSCAGCALTPPQATSGERAHYAPASNISGVDLDERLSI